MDKEEALIDFLKGLRIALNNASAYFKEHPYYIKSVKIFKQRIDTLFRFLSPIKIGIGPDSLFIDGRYWKKAIIYVDLAQMFHLRKIKSLEFRDGLTIEELIDFLSSVSRPIKEILRSGGMQNILNREKSPHLSIEELDYSELLRDEGEETKDIWVYLFGQAIERLDQRQIKELTDNFERIILKFKAENLCTDDELRENLHNFLRYLKDKEIDKFYNCGKALLRVVLRDKDVLKEDELGKISVFFKDLNKEDLAQVLWDELIREGDFNYLNFATFSRIIDEHRHREIAPILEEKIKNTAVLKSNPKIRKRIKDLFSGADSSFISALYRHALEQLSAGELLEAGFSFERNLSDINYRFLLFNLLAQEKNRETLSLILECLLKECDKIIAEKNLEHLKILSEVVDKKIKEDKLLADLFEGLERHISDFIENAVFIEKDLIGLEYFVARLKKSSLGFNFYLDKIFNEDNVNSYILRLLLKFFPEKLSVLYENLEKKYADIDFLGKVIDSLKKVESPLSMQILKAIFGFSNNVIKIEVLKAMQELSGIDETFLFSILRKGDVLLRKEAMLVLAKEEKAKRKAIGMLLGVPSFLMVKNKIILENMMIAEELGLREASDYLTVFSKKRFFWNRNIRKKAGEILKKMAC